MGQVGSYIEMGVEAIPVVGTVYAGGKALACTAGAGVVAAGGGDPHEALDCARDAGIDAGVNLVTDVATVATAGFGVGAAKAAGAGAKTAIHATRAVEKTVVASTQAARMTQRAKAVGKAIQSVDKKYVATQATIGLGIAGGGIVASDTLHQMLAGDCDDDAMPPPTPGPLDLKEPMKTLP